MVKSMNIKNINAYAMVSVIALGVDISIMYVHYFFYTDSIAYSAALGYLMGAIVSYVLSIQFVFKYRKYKKNKILESTLFLFTGFTGLAVTEFIMWCGADVFKLNIFFSKALAVLVSFITIYLLRYRFLFWAKKVKQEEE